MLRRLVGRPGGWTRWLIGSAIWMTLWACVAALTRNLLVLFLATVADAMTLLVRRLMVGDEDEFHADLHKQAARAVREGRPQRAEGLPTDPSTWLTRGDPYRMAGAPPPPSAEPGDEAETHEEDRP